MARVATACSRFFLSVTEQRFILIESLKALIPQNSLEVVEQRINSEV